MALPSGTKAPDFTLKSHEKNEAGFPDVTLSEVAQNGRVVLLFFPFAFSSVCGDSLCETSGDLSMYQNVNANILGISIDSPFALKAFAEEKGINFPMLSDFNKEVSKAYDVLHEDLMGFQGVSKRSIFVIEPDLTISYATSNDDPTQYPPLNELKEHLNK